MWLWINNNPLSFVNWKTGDPSGERNDCVTLYASSGLWSNIHCSSYKGYICKRPKSKNLSYGTYVSRFPFLANIKMLGVEL